MPKKNDAPEPGELSDDVQAAIAETVAEQKDKIDVELHGHAYEVDRKALNGIRFRLAMQKSQDMIALEIILGSAQFEKFIVNEGDNLESIVQFIEALGEASGSGNS